MKKFLFIFLLPFLLGSGFFVFEEYSLFSLRDYSLRVPDPSVEKRFWELLPPEGLRYWPLFLSSTPNIKLLLQKTMPVDVTTEFTGLGSVRTDVSFLEPWLNVSWSGTSWYLAKDGLMWKPSYLGLKLSRGPVWVLPDSFGRYFRPGMIERVPDGVFPAMFSVEILRNFVNILEGQKWFRDVSEVVVEKRAGEYLLKLSIGLDAQKLFCVGQGDEKKWRGLGVLLAQILPQIKKEGGNFVVDMTYTNKVVVSRDVHEGSSK